MADAPLTGVRQPPEPKKGAASGADLGTSPLWLVTREPLLNELVGYLAAERLRILDDPEGEHTLRFSRSRLREAREAFARMILRGERRLHGLCALLCDSLLSSPCTLQSVVVGQVESTGERFVLVQDISPRDLYSHTDLDLGSRQLGRLRFVEGSAWRQAELVANFVEYEANEVDHLGIHKFISRIKAEEEIWNKVVDEIFGFDELVRGDKQLRHLGRYVKDIFGVKALVADEEAVHKLQQQLTELEWSAEMLTKHGLPVDPSTRRLTFVEVKDYLAASRRKSSGWKALKSVVQWWGMTFEIQLQPRRNYYRERERASQESHLGFKSRREELRNQIAAQLPLFGFYRDLLRWLFLAPSEPAPRFRSVKILVEE